MDTKHKIDCNMSFGRKDKTCPRCIELINGSKPRSGWQKDYYENKKRNKRIMIEAIRKHDCKISNCMPVCTFGQW